MLAGTWLVVASVASGAGTCYLIAQLWQYREKPGARWFLASLVCQALWSWSYAAALLVFDPFLRFALEVAIWGLMGAMAVTFLAFALEYTGRGSLVRTRLARFLLAGLFVAIALLATNSWHHLIWTEFEVVRVAGVFGASYALHPWALAAAALVALFPLVASLILFDTVLSYGPLYRREAFAVGLSTIPPMTALFVWLFGLGPTPSVNFTTALFLPHIAFDAYAFVRSDMFEFHPATRRTGERAAIEDLGNPVVIVDEQGRIVTLNATATDLLGIDKQTALTAPLDEFLPGATVDPASDDQRVTLDGDGPPETYLVTSTPLRDGSDTHVGYTVVFQDVTDELRREQRLEVLNRVLRHNLRNDMTVVRGFASTANDEVDDADVSGMLDTVERKADELVALGEKARAVERVVGREPLLSDVSLDDLLEAVVSDVTAEFPDARVTLESPAVVIETDEETLRVVCRALLENALQHGTTDGTGARRTGGDGDVRVTVAEANDGASITISDDGPGIPEQELAVLDDGRETDLEHSTGLGLWLATWGAHRLGGDLSFDVSGDGTVANVRVPRRRSAE